MYKRAHKWEEGQREREKERKSQTPH